MTDIIESNDIVEGNTEYKTIASPNFTEVMYEAEKYLQQGWALSEEQYPFHSFVLYEVHLYKNTTTMNRLFSRVQAMQEGKEVMTTEKRREIMAKARAAKKINKEAEA
jgi:hypothetical protein